MLLLGGFLLDFGGALVPLFDRGSVALLGVGLLAFLGGGLFLDFGGGLFLDFGGGLLLDFGGREGLLEGLLTGLALFGRVGVVRALFVGGFRALLRAGLFLGFVFFSGALLFFDRLLLGLNLFSTSLTSRMARRVALSASRSSARASRRVIFYLDRYRKKSADFFSES